MHAIHPYHAFNAIKTTFLPIWTWNLYLEPEICARKNALTPPKTAPRLSACDPNDLYLPMLQSYDPIHPPQTYKPFKTTFLPRLILERSEIIQEIWA